MTELLNSDPSFIGYKKTKGNSIALKVKEGIEAGAEKTTKEWADELQVKPYVISQSLTWLRKKGYLFYPMDSKSGATGHGGKILDILKDQEHIRKTINRQDLVYLAPQLEAIARIVESSMARFPHLAPLFQNFLLDKATRISVIKNNLNGNNKFTSGKN